MLHRIGVARITYPRGVAISDADPATTVALPRRILAVPGVVSRPIRIGDLVGQETATGQDFYTVMAEQLQRYANVFRILNPEVSAAGVTITPKPSVAPTAAPAAAPRPMLASGVPTWVWIGGGVGAALVLGLMLFRGGGGGGRAR